MSGGGVYGGGGTLIISGGAFLNNTAELDGGGLYFASASVINATTFIDNTARTCVGVGNYGNMSVSNSVWYGNTAVLFGGGQSDINAAALLTMSSTTVSGNATCNLLAARCQGGGIFNRRGAMRLVNSTISSKQGVVGGVAISFGSVSARNTIIAGNLAVEGGTSPDVKGVSYSSGNNLIGNNFESTFFSAAGDVTRTRAAPVDRRLATTRQLRRHNAHAVAVF